MILLWWFYYLRDFKGVFRTCHESQGRKHQQNHDKHLYRLYGTNGSFRFQPRGSSLLQWFSVSPAAVRSSAWHSSGSAAQSAIAAGLALCGVVTFFCVNGIPQCLGRGNVFRCFHLSQTFQDFWSCPGVRFIVALYLNINHVHVCFGLLFWRSARSKSCLSHHDLPSCLNLPGWQRWQSMKQSDTFR